MPGTVLLRWFGRTPPVHGHKPNGGGKRRKVAGLPARARQASGESVAPGGGGAEEEAASSLGPIARLHMAALGVQQLIRVVAIPSVQLAARVLSRPWEPLQKQVQQHLAGMQAIKDACKALRVENLEGLQDVLGSLILSESVYKVLDMEENRAVMAVNNLKAHFPPQLVTLRKLQWAMPHAQHSYLMAEGSDALYVAFMGTKRPRDIGCNVDVWQDQVLFKVAASADSEQQGKLPAAHRGFNSRAKAIPVEALYHQARSKGKRLVLCGHSLGGAVAQLCTIRLLEQLPPAAHNTVSCIAFATPPVGNHALTEMVQENGWDRQLRNYLLPEDSIPRLLSSRQPAVVAAAAAAPGLEDPQVTTTSTDSRSAVLASVSLHTEALEAGKESRFPKLSKPFWVLPSMRRRGSPRRSDSAEVTEGKDGSTFEVAPDSSVGGAVMQDDQNADALANRISSSRALGAMRLRRIARHVEPVYIAERSSNTGTASLLEQGSQHGAPAAVHARLHDALAGKQCESTEQTAAAGGKATAILDAEFSLQPSGLYGLDTSEDDVLGVAAPKGRRRWVQRPSLEAMAQSAQAAARLVTLPLTAAASVPIRVTPQYYDVGQTLYVLPEEVTTVQPKPEQWKRSTKAKGSTLQLSSSSSAGRLAREAGPQDAASAAPAWPRLPWQWKASSSSAVQAVVASTDDGSSDDDATVTAAAVAGELENLAPTQLPKRTLFPMHRMLTYRQRILGICKDSVEGKVWLPVLPHFLNLPHPDDVTATQLLAPGMFPLKAEAVVPATHAAPDSVVAAAATATSTCHPQHLKSLAAGSPVAAAQAVQPSLPDGAPMDGDSAGNGQPSKPWWGQWGLLGLFWRQQARDEGAPIELEVRVEGKGLHVVTSAWVEGDMQLKSKGRRGPGVAPAQIVWQPPTPSPAAVQRNPLTSITPVASFFSWLAVTLGWVHLLRQLQPAGKQDYLVARVKVPATVVKQAWLTASNPLQAAVNDAHLPGVRVGPRLIMHLQSDFARTSLPLDIRVAADVQGQATPPGWKQFLTKKRWE